jgi:hypothetical protein
VDGACPGELDAIRLHVARVTSLGPDLRGFTDVGGRDPVMGGLQRVAVGAERAASGLARSSARWTIAKR